MVMSAVEPGPAFETVSLAALDAMPNADLDALSYGVVGLTAEGLVCLYNATESRLAGISTENVLGRHYFSSIAQCMNNFMIAQRFEDEDRLDETMDYVLTLRMRPTPVRLRLLKSPESPRSIILISRT